jgi:hypothetical protein
VVSSALWWDEFQYPINGLHAQKQKNLPIVEKPPPHIYKLEEHVRLTPALGAKAATDEAERANRRTLIVV